MPFSEQSLGEATPGPIQVPADYGLTGVGANHPTREQLGARFATERNWWIATAYPDGRPQVAPVWGLVIDRQLIFSSSPVAAKGRNLAHNPAIAIHLESGDEVCIVHGTVTQLTPAEVPAEFSKQYDEKYGYAPDVTDPTGAYYRVNPHVLMAWSETDFVNTVARWQFGSK